MHVALRGWGARVPLAVLQSRPSAKPPVAFQIYYYADQIYLSAGVASNDVQYVTAGTGAVNVFMTIVTVSIPEAVVPPVTKGGVMSGEWRRSQPWRELGPEVCNVPLGL